MVMRLGPLACAAGILLTAAQITAAAETPRQEVVRLVNEAVSLVQQKGLAAACQVLGTPNGTFWHGTTYVYVISIDKHWVCYPLKPALVGKSPAGIIDSTGGDLISDQIRQVTSPAGEGWVEYSWPNPITHKIQSKESFSKRVPGTNYIVVSGYYKK